MWGSVPFPAEIRQGRRTCSGVVLDSFITKLSVPADGAEGSLKHVHVKVVTRPNEGTQRVLHTGFLGVIVIKFTHAEDKLCCILTNTLKPGPHFFLNPFPSSDSLKYHFQFYNE